MAALSAGLSKCISVINSKRNTLLHTFSRETNFTTGTRRPRHRHIPYFLVLVVSLSSLSFGRWLRLLLLLLAIVLLKFDMLKQFKEQKEKHREGTTRPPQFSREIRISRDPHQATVNMLWDVGALFAILPSFFLIFQLYFPTALFYFPATSGESVAWV